MQGAPCTPQHKEALGRCLRALNEALSNVVPLFAMWSEKVSQCTSKTLPAGPRRTAQANSIFGCISSCSSRPERAVYALSVKNMTLAGLQPAIPGSVGRCLIHWATGPLVRFDSGPPQMQNKEIQSPVMSALRRSPCPCAGHAGRAPRLAARWGEGEWGGSARCPCGVPLAAWPRSMILAQGAKGVCFDSQA